MRVYVAGPMSWGNVPLNIQKGIEAGTQLIQAGHAPFVPHQSHLWALMIPEGTVTHEDWLEYDREWLLLCQAMIRIPGKSRGADQEERWARRHGIPIYGSVEEFLDGVHRGDFTEGEGDE